VRVVLQNTTDTRTLHPFLDDSSPPLTYDLAASGGTCASWLIEAGIRPVTGQEVQVQACEGDAVQRRLKRDVQARWGWC
jgi:hypothetical protein